jgi:hypothetical protein
MKWKIAGTLLLVLSASGWADVVFSDGTFNLSNYTQNTYNSNPSVGSFTVTQCSSCGNPGSALDINYTVNDPGEDLVTIVGETNNGWTYNPSTQGAIAGLNFSVDKYIDTPAVNTINTGIPLLLQGGNYYVDFVSGPLPKDQFNTITGDDLQAADFELLDFSNGDLDSSMHPNFSSSGGVITFGTAARFQGLPFDGSFTAEIRLDNLYFDIVPEPNSAALVLAMLGLMVPMALRIHGVRPARSPHSEPRPRGSVTTIAAT